MIHEELYVIVDDTRYRLDLKSPSGITLEYKSNLFGDLSKIEASHTYTFVVPATANNVRALQNITDLRSPSRDVTHDVTAEYLLNGINVAKDATLYVTESTNDTISCVMTWGRITALKNISSNDISITELGGTAYNDTIYEESDDTFTLDSKPTFIGLNDINSKFIESHKVIQPIYHAGLYSYEENKGNPVLTTAYKLKTRRVNSSEELEEGMEPENLGEDETDEQWLNAHKYAKMYLTPPPVMPVANLLKKIANKYGLVLDFPADKINDLCVPFVSIKATDALARQCYISTYLKMTHSWTVRMYFTNNTTYPDVAPSNYDSRYLLPIKDDYDDAYYLRTRTFVDGDELFKLRLEGAFWVRQPNIPKYNSLLLNNGEPVSFIIQARVVGGYTNLVTPWRGTVKTDWIDVASVEGEYGVPDPNDLNGASTLDDAFYKNILFNMSPEYGGKPLDIDLDIVKGAIGINDETGYKYHVELRWSFKYSDSNFPYIGYLYGYPDYNNMRDINVKIYRVVDEFATPSQYCNINVYKNLPDISCMEFIKSIYYATGSVPCVKSNGNIGVMTYKDLIRNVGSSSVDWSDKVLYDSDANIRYGASGIDGVSLGQTNYYLMKNESVSSDGIEAKNKANEDAYQTTYAKFQIVGTSASENVKTLYTFPYYGAYLRNKTYSGGKTYNNLHFWETENNYNYKVVDAKPILARLVKTPTSMFNGSTYVDAGNYLTLETWQPNANLLNDPNLSAMASIMTNADVVKEKLRLTETDLASLDFTAPVYLNKYNSYFAIAKITYSIESGIAEASLIRLNIKATATSAVNTTTFLIGCVRTGLPNGNDRVIVVKINGTVLDNVTITLCRVGGGDNIELIISAGDTVYNGEPVYYSEDDMLRLVKIEASDDKDTFESDTNTLYCGDIVYEVKISNN